jgi:hypothetical protein
VGLLLAPQLSPRYYIDNRTLVEPSAWRECEKQEQSFRRQTPFRAPRRNFAPFEFQNLAISQWSSLGHSASWPVVPAPVSASAPPIPFAGTCTPLDTRIRTMTRWTLAALLSFTLFSSIFASNDTAVHIHHRVRRPGEQPPPFSHKGTVVLTPTGGPSYAPANAFRDQLTAWVASAPDARYEIALETDGNQDDWPRSSVKLVSPDARAHRSSSNYSHLRLQVPPHKCL